MSPQRPGVVDVPKLGALAGLYPFGAYNRWISPEWALRSASMVGLTLKPELKTVVELVNPGAGPAEAKCIYLNADGSLATVGLGAPLSKTITIPPGQVASCSPEMETGPMGGDVPHLDLGGWMVIASNRPVFPRGSLGGHELRFYPVDCTDLTGLESVCTPDWGTQ